VFTPYLHFFRIFFRIFFAFSHLFFRADVVREIFFRYTEVQEGDTIDLGDDVEFTIQTRSSKEVACSIIKLPSGTVVFEDVGSEYFRGQVLKPLDRNSRFTVVGDGDALSGRVKYRGQDRSEKEVQFGEKDQVGDFTLKHGDWVKFVIAVDRRDKHPRATKIELLDESFKVSDERREQGTVQTIKEGFGFIQCADRDAKVFFHFSECLDVTRPAKENDECEFTVTEDPSQPSKLLATRIKYLPTGSVTFDVVIHKDAVGTVEVEPSPTSSLGIRKTTMTTTDSADSSDSPTPMAKAANEGVGKILYELNGLPLEIPLHANDCDLREFPHKGDVVRFDIKQLKSTKETSAVNVRIIDSGNRYVPTPPPVVIGSNPGDNPGESPGPIQQGYIAALKDGFGFIETIAHDREIFFHFSNVEGKSDRLEVGLEVEYTVFNREKGGKVSAENVRILRKGTITPIVGNEEMFHGKVVRPLRSVNPDQADYCGLIQVKNEDGSGKN
jgi:cold shock CspA family protein